MACNVLQLSFYRTNCRILLNAKPLLCSSLPVHHQNAAFNIIDLNSILSHGGTANCHMPLQNVQSCRSITTKPVSFLKDIVGSYKFKSALKKVGILNFKKSSLKRKGYNIYEQIADNIDYKSFFTKYNMPDTFHSWFVVMELHMWMIIVRLMSEEEEGRYLRNCVIEALWEDIREKAGLLGDENTSTAREHMKYLSEEFQAALLGYDEGLLGDDIVLAAALWRRFLSRDCNEPELVEDLVRYVRREVKILDTLTREEIFEADHKYLFEPIDKISSLKSIRN
ncbi:ubiquinol-cytochrome-c reductase complex assembly factor 1 [Nilaparvata lugens]|uniref:ubiquinol-cytochrome-c reductase complex assembly factor 1 n=1 Tax=Nilaparvata lugens TaxID=108931 RepID=UPI00193D411A|nr:ubiquinol-cytochrome-c reductase complex assembly factor 1 [Nilaparvata lugens]